MGQREVNALLRIADSIIDNKSYLTELDACIGDADHGINMARGFEAVKEKAAEWDKDDFSVVLKKTGMVLISTVGGASGPLYGTALLRASAAAAKEGEIKKEAIGRIFYACIQGIKDRGKAVRGEKTMLDALEPFYDSFMMAENEGMTLLQCFEAGCAAAESGMNYTRKIKATKGRASYLGERSIGFIDPGAASSYIILRTITECIKDKEGKVW